MYYLAIIRGVLSGFSITRLAVYAGVGMTALLIAYAAGAHKQRQKCNIAALRSELHTVKTDLEIQKQAAERAKEERDAINTKATSLAQQVSEYEEELSKRPATVSCSLTDDDVRRLRSIK